MNDVAKYPHLKASKRQGMLAYRRVVPERLRPLIGKHEIIVALGSATLAEALPRYHEVAKETDDAFRK